MISEIQAEFEKNFPFLQLRFYKKSHLPMTGSAAAEEWNKDIALGEIRSIHRSEDLRINGKMAVGELENIFEEHFCLHVQVFRATTGGLWLQTSSTDDWTLDHQNEKAEAYLRAQS